MLGRVLLHLASLNLISYSGPALVKADNNFLTGANDVIAVKRSEEGGGEEVDINASPFAVQFGKKDIWLPRSGHQVKVTVNNVPAPSLAMVLDSTGTAYFPTQEQPGGRQYRFWTALLGMGEPAPQHRTNSASPSQLAALDLRPGVNSIKYEVTTKSGSTVTTSASIHLINSTARLVVSDIDGTVTKSNVRGIVLPALGISDWKHEGVVELYSKIADQGYTIMFLTNRAIGQSEMTADYIKSLSEGRFKMPQGPVLLQVESVLGALETELLNGQPEVNKIAALSRVRGLFPGREPFWAGYGNKAWDILAYKAIGINPNRIFNVLSDSKVVSEGTGLSGNYSEMIRAVPDNYPLYP